MRAWALLLGGVCALGCAPRGGAPLAQPPVLASPVAEVYAVAPPGVDAPLGPRDPHVAEVYAAAGVGGWDESLAGAAGALALRLLGGQSADEQDVRWALVRAGWPGASVARGAAATFVGRDPDAAFRRVLADAATARHAKGLARARVGDHTAWVMLMEPAEGLPSGLPRTLARGERAMLPEGFAWRALRPDGSVQPLAGSIIADQPGLWMLEARAGEHRALTLPVFVDTEAPLAPPPLAGIDRSPDRDADLSHALARLAAWHGHRAPTRDPQLDILARVRGNDPVTTRSGLRGTMTRLGWFGEPATELVCEGGTLDGCLSRAWWDLDTHGALTGAHPTVGWVLDNGPRGLRLALVAGG